MTEPLRSDPPRLSAADLVEVEQIFSDLSEIGAADRPSLLNARCVGRDAVRLEVEALLAAHDRVDGFLEPVVRAAEWPERLSPGALVGSYRLLNRIGEGGMGDVFLAERADGVFTQKVAIKVTRASVRDAESARRFRSERQFLASLQHPNIVMLLDGGATPQGDAYLVMEYIDGVPITEYCRAKQLPLGDRIALLIQVCRAVQHAHQHAIVHRDLKPANILVAADGMVKVVDFGVAKLLEQSGAAGGTMTGLMPGPLTPNYASPEQLRGLAVTTACDVYSLGVLAYEILAGTRPYETTGQPLDRVLEIVLDTQPSRPSTVRLEPIAGTGPPALGYSPGTLKGDLDAIVLRAISKEPERRYGSAGELADDLERYLTRKPVLAREPSLGYLLQRVAARNRTLVATAALSVLAILAALSVAVWQRQVAIRAQARAESRFKDVRQLANALIFKIHDAVAPLPGSTPVRQTIVKEAVGYLERLERDAQDDPSLQLELAGAYRQIGGILGDPNRANLGDRDGALNQLQKARALTLPIASRPGASYDALLGLTSSDRQLASVLRNGGDPTRAQALALEAYTLAKRAYAGASQDTRLRHMVALCAFDMALVAQGQHQAEALRYWQETGAIFEQELAEQPQDANRQRNVALVEKYVAGLYEGQARFTLALQHNQRALELDRRRQAAAPGDRVVLFDLAVDYSNVGHMVEVAGDLGKAEEMFALSLQIREGLAATDPRDRLSQIKVGTSAWRLARVQRLRGRPAEARVTVAKAVRVLDAAVAIARDRIARSELAAALFEMGRVEEGDKHRQAACDLYLRSRALAGSEPTFASYLPDIAEAIEHATASCGSR